MKRVLLVPGRSPAGPGHWMSLWADAHPEYVWVRRRTTPDTDLDDRVAALDAALNARGGEAAGPRPGGGGPDVAFAAGGVGAGGLGPGGGGPDVAFAAGGVGAGGPEPGGCAAPGPVPAVLVATSLGCLTVARWAAAHTGPVAAALLTVPPDVPGISDAVRPLPFPAIVVGSRDDEHMSFARAQEFAGALGADFVDGGAVGHLNTASGYGPWPLGERLLAQLLAAPPRRS